MRSYAIAFLDAIIEALGSRVYGITWFLLAPILFPFITVAGKRNLKKRSDAGLIIIANHIAYLDILIIGSLFSPNTRINFFGKKELLDVPVLRTIFKHGHMIPVDRENPVSAVNIRAFKKALSVLKRGGTVCIFMQGGIGRSDIKESPVRLAKKTGAVMLPIHLEQKTVFCCASYGTIDIGPYTATIGEKIALHELGNGSFTVLAERLWKKISELAPEKHLTK